jgi:uncharacterized membrane protein
MLVAGSLHFSVPGVYERAIPAFLGPPRPWIYASGAAELAAGALLTSTRTRRAGAWWTATILVLIFPANVKMAVDGRITDSGMLATPAAAWARLPLQVPLVWWAWRLTR